MSPVRAWPGINRCRRGIHRRVPPTEARSTPLHLCPVDRALGSETVDPDARKRSARSYRGPGSRDAGAIRPAQAARSPPAAQLEVRCAASPLSWSRSGA